MQLTDPDEIDDQTWAAIRIRVYGNAGEALQQLRMLTELAN